MKDFQKFWTRKKMNAESQEKQSDQPKKNCFKLISENQSVVYANQRIVFISTLQKHRSNNFNSSER